MDFKGAISIINQIIPETSGRKYDGILVKKLEASNTLDEGRTTNQTHIAITGEQMDIFPYLMADGYFNRNYDERDEKLKKYFITQVPVRLYKSNVDMLRDKNEMPACLSFAGNNMIQANVSIVRSRRKSATDQAQLSLTSIDDPAFVAFRRLIHAGDYMIILKHRETLDYDCYGIRKSTGFKDQLKSLNNKFYKEGTNTRVNAASLIPRKRISSAGRGTNILYYGVPGSGKSYAVSKICSDETVMERVVFHPDYSYSDFVGQIMPRLNKANKLEYVFTPGPFTKILKKAYHDPATMYYLVIEEINRGNAPAIFGEIFQLLDRKDASIYPDEVGESEYGISNYDIAKEVYDGDPDHSVKIPSNLTLLATMNTSDQNVFTLDTAFQRRWDMRHVPNRFTDLHAADLIEGSEISWGTFAMIVNDLASEINTEMIGAGDKRLGAYFAKANELKVDVFSEKVLKYLWDDVFRMDKQVVFDKGMTSLEKVLEAYQNSPGDPLKAVLKSDIYQKMYENMKKDRAEIENVETDGQPE
jgi:GTPase subunit of restriction endonuclease